jgi:aryl-alcohol dehydrogenase-like predicted oxidoreductase
MPEIGSLSRLALGTVQLGLPYGIANTTGVPSEDDAVAVIRAAIAAGVSVIDTARAYGDSERRIGLALAGLDSEAVTVVTKLDPLAGIGAEDREAALQAAAASIESSRAALRRDVLDVLLLHRAAHRTAWDGAVWNLLRDTQSRGTIGRLGVSVQSPQELAAALDDVPVAHVQLPFNILDHRWHNAGLPSRLRARTHVTVHVRSIFLQGLLAAPATAHWPRIAGVEPDGLRHRLVELARRCGRDALPDLALAYVRAQDWIDGIVIGVESRPQLAYNLALFGHSPLTADACTIIERLPPVPEQLLDPSQWPPH